MSAPGEGASLSLVLPAYNEEARLPALLEQLSGSAAEVVSRAGMTLAEAVIVDDGSTDGTPEILAAAADGLVKPVLEFDANRGKGAAIAAGVAKATGSYVLLADIDLSTPLEELPKLFAALRDGADVAIGSRAVDGAVVERGPLHRKLLGKAFNGTVRALTGLDVMDTQCGFKLMSTEVARVLLAEQSCSGFAFDVELLMRAKAAGLQIAEVPVLYLHDARSRVRVASASLEMLRDVCGLAYRHRVRGERPAAGHPRRAPG